MFVFLSLSVTLLISSFPVRSFQPSSLNKIVVENVEGGAKVVNFTLTASGNVESVVWYELNSESFFLGCFTAYGTYVLLSLCLFSFFNYFLIEKSFNDFLIRVFKDYSDLNNTYSSFFKCDVVTPSLSFCILPFSFF